MYVDLHTHHQWRCEGNLQVIFLLNRSFDLMLGWLGRGLRVVVENALFRPIGGRFWRCQIEASSRVFKQRFLLKIS